MRVGQWENLEHLRAANIRGICIHLQALSMGLTGCHRKDWQVLSKDPSRYRLGGGKWQPLQTGAGFLRQERQKPYTSVEKANTVSLDYPDKYLFQLGKGSRKEQLILWSQVRITADPSTRLRLGASTLGSRKSRYDC